MGTIRTIHTVRNDSPEKLPVPPGFVSLTSFTLKRMVNGEEVADPISIGKELKPGSVDAPLSNLVIEKFRTSLKQRPWILHNQSDCAPQKYDSEQTEVGMERPLRNSLPKGMIRGCATCHDCVKVIARWHPEESCLPVLGDAPVFYPTEEEFEDTLKYVAKIHPAAEHYGICRIVPPASWKPPCLLKDSKTWKTSTFSTHVQQIDGLQNIYLKRKLSRFHEKVENKRPKVLASMKLEASNECVAAPKEAKFVAGSSDFEHGPDHTLLSFKKYADDFKRQYFGQNDEATDPDGSLISVQERQEPLIERIEGEYWRIIENPREEIEVLYGTNLESSTLGSGFPTKESHENKAEYSEYVGSGWNLNNIPKLSGSLLPLGCCSTSDILVPQLFIGMCFASQCWRNEDHHLYSLCYIHLGSPKVWYGIPGRYCFKFMEVVKKLFPQLSKHPSLLHEFVTQLSPSTLMSEGIPVYRCVQHPSEFILIFPGAYHSEFDCGFNCSESVCFAPFDWLPHGQNTVELYGGFCRRTLISHDKLLLGAAIEAVSAQWESFAVKNDSFNNQLWRSVCGKDGILTKALKSRVRLERMRREHLCNLSLVRTLDEFDAATKRECSICLCDLYLSAVSCSCSPNTFTCLRHAKQLCSCAWSDKCFLFRYGIAELSSLVEALEGNLKAIHSWAKKKIQPVQQLNPGDKGHAETGKLKDPNLISSRTPGSLFELNGIASKKNPMPTCNNNPFTHEEAGKMDEEGPAHGLNGIASSKNVMPAFNKSLGTNEEDKATACMSLPVSSQQNIVHHSDSNKITLPSGTESVVRSSSIQHDVIILSDADSEDASPVN